MIFITSLYIPGLEKRNNKHFASNRRDTQFNVTVMSICEKCHEGTNNGHKFNKIHPGEKEYIFQ